MLYPKKSMERNVSQVSIQCANIPFYVPCCNKPEITRNRNVVEFFSIIIIIIIIISFSPTDPAWKQRLTHREKWPQSQPSGSHGNKSWDPNPAHEIGASSHCFTGNFTLVISQDFKSPTTVAVVFLGEEKIEDGWTNSMTFDGWTYIQGEILVNSLLHCITLELYLKEKKRSMWRHQVFPEPNGWI